MNEARRRVRAERTTGSGGVPLQELRPAPGDMRRGARILPARSVRKNPIYSALVLLVLLLMLVLAWIPLNSTSQHESKAFEAKAAIGTIKDRMRAYYVRNNNTLAGTDLTAYIPGARIELAGEYYAATDYSIRSINGTRITLAAEGSEQDSRPAVEYTFDCATGHSDGGFIVTPQ